MFWGMVGEMDQDATRLNIYPHGRRGSNKRRNESKRGGRDTNLPLRMEKEKRRGRKEAKKIGRREGRKEGRKERTNERTNEGRLINEIRLLSETGMYGLHITLQGKTDKIKILKLGEIN